MPLRQHNTGEETNIRSVTILWITRGLRSPTNETEATHGLDRENALCDTEPRHVFREGRRVAPGQELHDGVQMRRALE